MSDRTTKATNAEQNVPEPSRKPDSLRQVDALSQEIERLAAEMESNKRPGRMNMKALQQMEELTELLKRQRGELLEEAEKASDVLEACQDELQRISQNERTFARLKQLQSDERARNRENRRAA